MSRNNNQRGNTQVTQTVDESPVIANDTLKEETVGAEPESVQEAVVEVDNQPVVEEPKKEAVPQQTAQPTQPTEDVALTNRVALLFTPFADYAAAMGKGVPNDQNSILRHQRNLYRAFRNLLTVDDSRVFAKVWPQVLELWNKNESGAFDDVRLYRHIDLVKISDVELLEFQTILRFVDALHEPELRAAKVREIDLNRALPEIGGVDGRGYLASYVRRFA